jgi:hypothetical protein
MRILPEKEAATGKSSSLHPDIIFSFLNDSVTTATAFDRSIKSNDSTSRTK